MRYKDETFFSKKYFNRSFDYQFFSFSSIYDYKRENSQKLNEISDSKKQQNRLAALFKAIRQQNNNFVKFSLLTKENIERRKKLIEQSTPEMVNMELQ